MTKTIKIYTLKNDVYLFTNLSYEFKPFWGELEEGHMVLLIDVLADHSFLNDSPNAFPAIPSSGFFHVGSEPKHNRSQNPSGFVLFPSSNV